MVTKVKTVLNGETRRVKLPEATFAALVAGVRKAYNLEQAPKLSWKDEDGDTIMVVDDDGLEDAIEESGKMLKLFVELQGAGAGSAPSSAPPEHAQNKPGPVRAPPHGRPGHQTQGGQKPTRGRPEPAPMSAPTTRGGGSPSSQHQQEYRAPQQAGPAVSHDRYPQGQSPKGFRAQGQDRQQYQMQQHQKQAQHEFGYQNGRQNGRGDRRNQQGKKLNPRAAGFQPHSPMGRAQNPAPGKYANAHNQYNNTTRDPPSRHTPSAGASGQWDQARKPRARQTPPQGLQMPPNISPELLPEEAQQMGFNGFSLDSDTASNRTSDRSMGWQQQQYRQQLQMHQQYNRPGDFRYKQQQQRKMNGHNQNGPEAFFNGNFPQQAQMMAMQQHGLPTSFRQGRGEKQKKPKGGRRGQQQGGRSGQPGPQEMDWAKQEWHPGMDGMGAFADGNKVDGGKRETRGGMKERGGKKPRGKNGQDTAGMTGKQRRQTRRRQVKEPIKWKAQIVKHVTLQDRSMQMPGQILEKVWLMKNIGSQVWKDVQLICVKEDAENPMNVEEAYPIPKCNAGREVEVKAYIQVPKKEGRHCSYYRLCNSNGRKFGPRIWADIIVPETDPATETRATVAQSTGNANGRDANGDEYDNALDVRQYLKNAEASHESAYKKNQEKQRHAENASEAKVDAGSLEEMKAQPSAI